MGKRIAQRMVRARRTLGDAQVPFEVPREEDQARGCGQVLEVLYLVFNEGYAATAGADLMRPALSKEALRLGELLVSIAPAEPEAHALLALMRLQESRATARVDDAGEPVLLEKQDRTRWDGALIEAGLAELQRANGLAEVPGPYSPTAGGNRAQVAACTPARRRRQQWKAGSESRRSTATQRLRCHRR